MSFPEAPPLLTSKAAAERVGISRSAFQRHVAAGTITPAMDLAGRTGPKLFTPDAVDDLRARLAAFAVSHGGPCT